MKTRLVFFVFFWMMTTVFSPVKAASFDALKKKVRATYENTRSLSIDFTQKVWVASLEREIEKRGRILIQKPKKFRVDYEGEGSKLYVSDGKRMVVYQNGDTQAHVYAVDSKTFTEETLAFLEGLGALEVQFQIEALPDDLKVELNPAKTLDWLFLKPKNPESQMESLLLGFDRSQTLLREVYIRNNSGNTNHYLFRNFEIDASVSEDEFIFVKPKGVKEVTHR